MAFDVRRCIRSFSLAILIAALALGGAGAVPAQARHRGHQTRTSVSGSWSSTAVGVGGRVVVQGRVSTPRVRRTVVLQRLTSHGWATVRSARTVRGAWSLVVPTSAAGATTYRVRVLATKRYAAAVAPAARVAVRISLPGKASAFAFLSREHDPNAPVARWNPCSEIHYRVNLTQASAGALADVQGALARVSASTGLRFAYQGTTTFVPSTSAAYPAGTELVLAWVTPGSTDLFPRARAGYDAAGYGGAAWQYVTSGGATRSQIVRGYALFNAALPLATGFGPGPAYGWQGTRGQLIMHEVGHAVGLAHPGVADQSEIMFPTMTRKAADYAAGDRAGLRLLGSTQGCLSAALPGLARGAVEDLRDLGGATRLRVEPGAGLHWSAID